jgi:hypothetical protein
MGQGWQKWEFVTFFYPYSIKSNLPILFQPTRCEEKQRGSDDVKTVAGQGGATQGIIAKLCLQCIGKQADSKCAQANPDQVIDEQDYRWRDGAQMKVLADWIGDLATELWQAF